MKHWMTVAFAMGCGASVAADGFESPRADAVKKTDAEWQKQLTAEQYRILRKKGTERAFTGQYWDNTKAGLYACGGCGLVLFSSEDKFKSGTGWPSFTRPVDSGVLADAEDNSLFMSRTEILCNRCGGHLGHVFPDGPPPTGQRFCVNGNALEFRPKAAAK